MSHQNGKAPRFKIEFLKIVCKVVKQNGFKYFTCHLRD